MNSINGNNNNIAGRDITIHNYLPGLQIVTPPTKAERLANLRMKLSNCKRSLFINRLQRICMPTGLVIVLSLACMAFLAFHFITNLLLQFGQSVPWVYEYSYLNINELSNPLYMFIPAGLMLLAAVLHRKAITPIIRTISLLKSEISILNTKIQIVKTSK